MIITDERTEVLRGQLLVLLREHLGEPGLAYEGEPTRLTGGFWAELLSFRVRPAPAGWDRPLVARVMPDRATAAKEAAVQLEVAVQGYPTPMVRLVRGPEAGIDGRALMVMDLADGQPLLAGLDGTRALVALPSLVRRLPIVLADVTARLHELDMAGVEARLAAADGPRYDLDAMLAHLGTTAASLGRPALAGAVAWLAEHRPAGEADVICHGDLHPFNVLVDATGRPTVLDWSAAVLAPRTYDLGFTSLMMEEPPLVAPAALRPLIGFAGRAVSRRFVRAYERAAGVAVDRAALRWHQNLVCARALTEVAGWAAAGTLGERRGHPWVINEAALVGRLAGLTGVSIPLEHRA